MYVEVLRPITTAQGVLMPGEIVDASNWTTVRQLTDQRKIRPVDAPESEAKPSTSTAKGGKEKNT